MSILDALVRQPAAPEAKQQTADFDWDEEHPGWTVIYGMSRSGSPKSFEDFVIKGFRRNAVVRTCINTITSAVTEAPFQAYRRVVRGGVEDYEHAAESGLQDVLESPNDRDPGIGLWERVLQHYLLGGNGVLRKIRAGGPLSSVVGLTTISPGRLVKAITDSDGVPVAFDIRTSDNLALVERFPANDIVLIPDIDPLNEIFGLPRLLAAAQELEVDKSSSDYVQEILNNHGTPGLIIGVDTGTREAEIDRAEEVLTEKFGPGRGRGKMAIASGARMIKEVGFNLKDLELPGVRIITGERICAIFGVDPMLVGLGSASKGSSSLSGAEHREARHKLFTQTIVPLQKRIKSYLDLQLAYEWGDYRVFPDYSEVQALKPDRDALMKRGLTMAQAGAYSREEIRVETEHEAELPAGQVFFGPLSLVESDSLGGMPEDAKSTKSEPAEYPLTFVAPTTWTKAQRDAAWKAWDQYARAWEPRFKAEALGLLYNWADRIEAVTRQTLREKKQVTEESVLAWQEAMGVLEDEYHAAWFQRFKALTTEVTQVVGAGVAGELGVSFDLYDAIIQEWLDKRPNLLAGGVTDSTFAAIKDSIAEGMRAGEGTQALAGRVSSVFHEGYSRVLPSGKKIQVLSAAKRAVLIARTEASSVVNGASLAEVRASGLTMTKEWLTQGDDRVRPEHQAMDGETVGADEAFSNGDDYPQSVNERCTLIYHVA